MLDCQPNAGHCAIAGWERNFRVSVVTQNVDDLHERTGSSDVLHLHGELRKSRSTRNPDPMPPYSESIDASASHSAVSGSSRAWTSCISRLSRVAGPPGS